MKKLRNSENLDCAIISLFYPNGRLNQASQGNWDNMPQALGRAELGYAMAHGRVILHRQEEITQKNQKTLSRDSVMTGSSKLTTLNLLSRILELEFGELYLQHYGLFTDSKATNLEPAAELLDAQHRFAARLVELLGKTNSGADILVVGDTLLSLARELAERPIIRYSGSGRKNC